jgi:macrodomain Ter protein organizer (MatP/YcbG family)
MNTISTSRPKTSRRKLIDIPEDVFTTLSMKATAMGMNLKKYIEHLLIQEAEEMDDAEVYRYLLSTRPEGKVMLTETEQDEFERKMGIGKYR